MIGPGAIGAFVAARLAAAGHPVTVACRTSRTADEIGARGLVAEDHKGKRTVADVRAVVAPEEAVAEPRIVFLATKAADAAQALATWLPHVPDHAPVVGMQNGIMAETLAPMALGRYVDTVVHFPATLVAPGHSAQTGPGGFEVGIWPADGPAVAAEAHVAQTAELLSLIGPTQTTENIRGAKWTKLIINSCITSLGVMSGETLGELLKSRRARDAFLAITTEGETVGRADGVVFETVQGFHPGRLSVPPGTSFLRRFFLHQALKTLGTRYRRHRSSSLQSLERGGRTEVDFLNGVIVRTGRAHGIGTPANRAVVDVVHDIEAGHATPGPALLERLPLP